MPKYVMRITDGYHAEEFMASTLAEFRRECHAALERFTEWRLAQIPIHQTRKREFSLKYEPDYQLHVFLGEWAMVGAYPQAWGLGYDGAGARPRINTRALFKSSKYLFDCVGQTVSQGHRIANLVESIVE